MKRAAVLGYPIHHSLSPKLHGYWLSKNSIKGSYEAIETKPENLINILTKLADEKYSGVNLTVPLKEQIIPHLDEISNSAKMIGAVNLVLFKQGKLIGENSDAYGFMQNLRVGAGELLPYLNHAVILGAGGAARAVIAGLLEAGIKKITLTNRTQSRAKELAKMHESIHVVDWNQRNEVLTDATLLVNTTSLGMKNQPSLEVSLTHLPSSALVTDIVYNPLETDLLKQARIRGNKTVDGLGMLIHQAVPAFDAFFGVEPLVDDAVREQLL